MENIFSSKKTKVIVIAVCIVIALIAVIVILTSDTGSSSNNGGGANNQGENSINGGVDNTIVTNKEIQLDDSKAQDLFDMLPLIYTEEFAPFTDAFLLTAAMTKVSCEEEPNYMASHVDQVVKEIFGENVAINKANVSNMNIAQSLYYYYPETGMYSVIPIGMESIYKTQLLKYATKDDNYTYVYTNEINGTWHSEEEKTVVVIGDKNGNDLVKSYDDYTDIEDYSVWQKEYADMLPVVRYTLKEQDGKYVLVGVEKVNY